MKRWVALLGDMLVAGKTDGLSSVAQLLTVGEDGFAFACLLSCRQLVVDDEQLLALLAGKRPNEHLHRNEKAVLCFVHDDAYATLRLRALSHSASGEANVWRFDVIDDSIDARAELLSPMRYRSAALDELEGASLSEILARET